MVRENDFGKIGPNEMSVRVASSDAVMSSQLEELGRGDRDSSKEAKEENAFGPWTVDGLRKFISRMQKTLTLRIDLFEKIGDEQKKKEAETILYSLGDIARSLYQIEKPDTMVGERVLDEIKGLYS